MNRTVVVPGESLEVELVIPGVCLLKHKGQSIAVFMGEFMKGTVFASAMTHAEASKFVSDTRSARQALRDDEVIRTLEDLL